MVYGGRPSGESVHGGGRSISDDAILELLEQGGHFVDTAVGLAAAGDDHVVEGKGLFLHIGYGLQLELV